MLLVLAALVGCENATQRKLFDQAVELEQSPAGDFSILTVEAYRKVVRLDASSALGKRAQQRIDQIQSNIKANQMINEQRRARRAIELNN